MFLYLWAVSATYITILCFKCVLSFIILSLRCVLTTQLLCALFLTPRFHKHVHRTHVEGHILGLQAQT